MRGGLAEVGYLADDSISGVVYLADRLAKPVLVEGPAGTGKTQLAKSVAELTGARLIRLQCYEGLDESKALYEWNYRKQLLRIQAGEHGKGETRGPELAGARGGHLLGGVPPDPPAARGHPGHRAGRAAGRRGRPGRARDRGAAARDPLASTRCRSPSSGTVRATQLPMVFLTSNNTRELSEALKRRCLYLHIDYPDLDREREIVRARVPGISEELADQVARIVRSLRTLELRKAPSVSETLDWARTLVLLGVETIDAAGARDTLHILLKYQADIERAAKELLSASAAEADGARPPLRLRHRAAPRRPAGLADRAPRRGRGGQAHPPRGPRGAQVRAGRHAGEVVVALAGLRDGLRGVLRRADRRRRARRGRRARSRRGGRGRREASSGQGGHAGPGPLVEGRRRAARA